MNQSLNISQKIVQHIKVSYIKRVKNNQSQARSNDTQYCVENGNIPVTSRSIVSLQPTPPDYGFGEIMSTQITLFWRRYLYSFVGTFRLDCCKSESEKKTGYAYYLAEKQRIVYTRHHWNDNFARAVEACLGITTFYFYFGI